jgi:hypothetical protein
MADILIIGTSPKSEEGKEYFLHCLDWWWEILFVINRLLKDRFPVKTYFIREFPLAAPAPEMNDEQCIQFSLLLKDVIQDGSAVACLKQLYRDVPNLYEYYGDDQQLIKSSIEERISQMDEFVSFLWSCGGCEVKWYYPPE